jgi:pimeloyl-ACP methyl ester carboxylesterase
LLDGQDVRHASGTLEECREKLAAATAELGPMKGKAVIVIHGIIRSSKSFSRMRSRLEEAGYQVIGFDYPSTRVDIPASAAYLHQCIESLEGIEEIDFVVHSMGGLLVRAYLKEHRDPRIRRMVMLGVPNLGAHMADKVRGIWLYRAIFGPAGQQLVSDPEGLIAGLPTPDFEFGIIAGSGGTEAGYNLIIPGDDDGTVAVESTRLPGATDFIRVRGLHSFLMFQDDCIDYTLRFLKEGHFREEGEREPIPKTEPTKAAATVYDESIPTKKAK